PDRPVGRHDDARPAPAGPGQAWHGHARAGQGIRQGQADLRGTKPQEPAMSSIDFTSFLKLMAHQKASHLFITAGMPPSIKVNGKISPIIESPLTQLQARGLAVNVMTPPQREEFEKTHEANFAIGVSGVGRFRVSCFYQRNQVGMVLRRIETRIPTIE